MSEKKANEEVINETNAYHFFRDVTTGTMFTGLLHDYTADPSHLLWIIQHPMDFNKEIRTYQTAFIQVMVTLETQ